MKEILELRVNMDYANLLFSDNEGKILGNSIKVIELTKDDPRYQQIPIVAKNIQEKQDRAFFFGWRIKRIYLAKELDFSRLLHLKIMSTFEPSGEECGTMYDESKACPVCGFNREQKSSLQLKKGSIPAKDIAKTIAGEVVVSERFVMAFNNYGFKGCSFEPVKFNNEDSGYYQIVPTSPKLELSPNTVAGINPFDLSENSEDELYKCPYGHTIGLNLISEPHVLNTEFIGRYDLFSTTQNIGVKRGLLRPEPLYMCSTSFRKMIIEEDLKGCEFEVARTD